jgi:phosphate butyryltransferase
MLMKGLIKTADLLREVLDRENGLRSGTILSHVGILSSPVLERIFLVTDAAIIPYPGLAVKAEMIRNAVAAANGMGIRFPKVAPLAAVEVVNPDMAATTDAASLTVMNRRARSPAVLWMVRWPWTLQFPLRQPPIRKWIRRWQARPISCCSTILKRPTAL